MKLVCSYYFNQLKVDVYEQREEGTNEPFYDLFIDFECRNLGDPFWELPDFQTVKDYLDS